MIDNAQKTSGWIWLLTFLFIYFIAVSIWVAMLVNPDSIEASLIAERTSNSAIASTLDKSSWELSREYSLFAAGAEILNERILNSKAIVEGQTGIIENVWQETPLKMSLYGTLLDYRLAIFSLLIPTLIIIFIVSIIDAIMVRKVQLYRNSFSSPLRHTIGGQVLGVNLSILTIILFFMPVSIPFWVFALIVLIKTFGWWLWLVNLPKRM